MGTSPLAGWTNYNGWLLWRGPCVLRLLNKREGPPHPYWQEAKQKRRFLPNIFFRGTIFILGLFQIGSVKKPPRIQAATVISGIFQLQHRLLGKHKLTDGFTLVSYHWCKSHTKSFEAVPRFDGSQYPHGTGIEQRGKSGGYSWLITSSGATTAFLGRWVLGGSNYPWSTVCLINEDLREQRRDFPPNLRGRSVLLRCSFLIGGLPIQDIMCKEGWCSNHNPDLHNNVVAFKAK